MYPGQGDKENSILKSLISGTTFDYNKILTTYNIKKFNTCIRSIYDCVCMHGIVILYTTKNIFQSDNYNPCPSLEGIKDALSYKYF